MEESDLMYAARSLIAQNRDILKLRSNDSKRHDLAAALGKKYFSAARAIAQECSPDQMGCMISEIKGHQGTESPHTSHRCVDPFGSGLGLAGPGIGTLHMLTTLSILAKATDIIWHDQVAVRLKAVA